MRPEILVTVRRSKTNQEGEQPTRPGCGRKLRRGSTRTYSSVDKMVTNAQPQPPAPAPGGTVAGGVNRSWWWWMVTPVVFGAFGGAAPQVLETLQDAEALGVPFWKIPGALGRLGAFPVYATIGAVVALANRETDMMKAILLGISAPALILNYTDGATIGAGRSTVGLHYVLHAEAQSPTGQEEEVLAREEVLAQEDTRPLTIELQNRLIFDKTVIIHHAERPPSELRETETGTWFVPTSEFSMSMKGATALGNVIVPVETPVIHVPPGSGPIVIRMTMDPEQTNFGGFLDGLGFDRIARERYTDLNPRLVVDEADADEADADDQEPTRNTR